MTVTNDKVETIHAGPTFLTFCEQNNFGKWTVDWVTKITYFELNRHDIKCFFDLNMIFNGTKGGLVLGRLHSAGGIHLISPILNGLAYMYVGEMEGWEYLSAPIVNHKIGEKFAKINNSTIGIPSCPQTEFEIPNNCKIIDTKNISPAVIVLSSGRQAIINRNATKKYIHKIIKLEKQ